MSEKLKNFKKGIALSKQELIDGGILEQDIDTLVSSGELCKVDFVDDFYYINEVTVFEEFGLSFDTVITPDEIVNRLYVGNGWAYGCIYKYTLLNRLGVCNQVPYVRDIITLKVEEETELVWNNQKFCLYPYKKLYGKDKIDLLDISIDVVYKQFRGWWDSPESTILENIARFCNTTVEKVKKHIKEREL